MVNLVAPFVSTSVLEFTINLGMIINAVIAEFAPREMNTSELWE